MESIKGGFVTMIPNWKNWKNWKIMPPWPSASASLSQAYPIMSATMRSSSAAAWMKKCS